MHSSARVLCTLWLVIGPGVACATHLVAFATSVWSGAPPAPTVPQLVEASSALYLSCGNSVCCGVSLLCTVRKQANNPAMNIATCRVRVLRRSPNSLVDLTGCSDVGMEVRQQWVEKVILAFKSPSDVPGAIRAWDFILNLDGTAESCHTAPTGADFIYPIHFRAPPPLLDEPDQLARVKRIERFALGSMLYEILTGNKPFSGLSDDEVAARFHSEEAPEGIFAIDLWPIICACWGYKAPENWKALGKFRRPSCVLRY
jgi:hypothetical protein